MRTNVKVLAAGLGIAAMVGAGLGWRALHGERAGARATAAAPDGEQCTSPESCAAHAHGDVAPAERPTGRPRILAFSSATCAACQKMAPIVAAAERACATTRDVMHVDVDADDGAALASTYAVSNIPTWLSIDADGNEVARLSGVQPQQRIEEAIEEVRGTRCAQADQAPSGRPM